VFLLSATALSGQQPPDHYAPDAGGRYDGAAPVEQIAVLPDATPADRASQRDESDNVQEGERNILTVIFSDLMAQWVMAIAAFLAVVLTFIGVRILAQTLTETANAAKFASDTFDEAKNQTRLVEAQLRAAEAANTQQAIQFDQQLALARAEQRPWMSITNIGVECLSIKKGLIACKFQLGAQNIGKGLAQDVYGEVTIFKNLPDAGRTDARSFDLAPTVDKEIAKLRTSWTRSGMHLIVLPGEEFPVMNIGAAVQPYSMGAALRGIHAYLSFYALFWVAYSSAPGVFHYTAKLLSVNVTREAGFNMEQDTIQLHEVRAALFPGGMVAT
jgi:hypothetical protein